MSYERLRQEVREAWDAVGEDQQRDLIVTMKQQYEAVIEAKGLYKLVGTIE